MGNNTNTQTTHSTQQPYIPTAMHAYTTNHTHCKHSRMHANKQAHRTPSLAHMHTHTHAHATGHQAASNQTHTQLNHATTLAYGQPTTRQPHSQQQRNIIEQQAHTPNQPVTR